MLYDFASYILSILNQIKLVPILYGETEQFISSKSYSKNEKWCLQFLQHPL